MTAILVIVQWLGAHTIDWFARGPLRVDARSAHIAVGILIGVVLAVRVAWRSSRGRILPPAGGGLFDRAAKAVHFLLYVLVAAMVLVGLFLVWSRGDSIFNLFTIPAFGGGNHALADQVGEVHDTIGWMILGLAGIHAAAALFHQFVLRDGLLDRMRIQR